MVYVRNVQDIDPVNCKERDKFRPIERLVNIVRDQISEQSKENEVRGNKMNKQGEFIDKKVTTVTEKVATITEKVDSGRKEIEQKVDNMAKNAK